VQPLQMIIQWVPRIQMPLVMIEGPNTGKGMGVFDKYRSDDGGGGWLEGIVSSLVGV
jgi:hypothetical protein